MSHTYRVTVGITMSACSTFEVELDHLLPYTHVRSTNVNSISLSIYVQYLWIRLASKIVRASS
jgi:hypothetical protein